MKLFPIFFLLFNVVIAFDAYQTVNKIRNKKNLEKKFPRFSFFIFIIKIFEKKLC